MGRDVVPGTDDRFFVKRDDLTSSVYGGNKVRTLEILFAQAKLRGCTRVLSTGAFGSNHAVATVLHAPRVGLGSGVLLFPQPISETARDNLAVTLSYAGRFEALWHWSALPFRMWRLARETRHTDRSFIMVPGGATAHGALGYVSAALELALQVQRGQLPRPDTVVVGVGSTCTSAGLLVGFHLAARLGVGFRSRTGEPAPPELVSVRVTPWPVTSRTRVVGLAVKSSRLLATLVGDPSLAVRRAELDPHLVIDGRYLGRGYGHPTSAGRRAIHDFRASGGPELDTTYSAKAAAAALALASATKKRIVFWSTKSTAPLPSTIPARIGRSPRFVQRWMGGLAELQKPSSAR